MSLQSDIGWDNVHSGHVIVHTQEIKAMDLDASYQGRLLIMLIKY